VRSQQSKPEPVLGRRGIPALGWGALLAALFLCWPLRAFVPYTNDAHTVLLDHLDGSTQGTLSGYQADVGPCGSERPAAPAASSYVPGLEGPGKALLLSHPAGCREPAATYLRYNSQLLSMPEGTLEFWILLSTYGPGLNLVDQQPYFTCCEGRTFSLTVQSNGVVNAAAWMAFGVTSGTETVPLQRWTHLAVTWGSTGARLYLNGKLVGVDFNAGMPAPGYSGSVFIQLGTHVEGAANALDELRISDVQRTEFNVAPGLSPGGVQMFPGFTVTGPPGAVCRVEFAPTAGETNKWTPLGTLTLTNGTAVFIDSTASGPAARKYRTVWLP